MAVHVYIHTRDAVRPPTLDVGWQEEKHPRDPKGKFTKTNASLDRFSTVGKDLVRVEAGIIIPKGNRALRVDQITGKSSDEILLPRDSHFESISFHGDWPVFGVCLIKSDD